MQRQQTGGQRCRGSVAWRQTWTSLLLLLLLLPRRAACARRSRRTPADTQQQQRPSASVPPETGTECRAAARSGTSA
ncbi:hypothetical protein BC831DRAFT_444960, partial [Entophlyctis helioformis]